MYRNADMQKLVKSVRLADDLGFELKLSEATGDLIFRLSNTGRYLMESEEISDVLHYMKGWRDAQA